MSNKIRGYIALAVALIVFNTIAFVIPVEHNDTFWIAYSFTDIAFLAQIAIWKWAFFKVEAVKSKFLGISIVYVGMIYLMLQIVAFVICIAVSAKGWVTVIVCMSALGISLILMISGDTAREEISRVEQKIFDNTAFMKKLQLDIEQLVLKETDPNTREKLLTFAKKVRFSDPISSVATREIEDSIQESMDRFNEGYISVEGVNQVITLVEQRNNICKEYK